MAMKKENLLKDVNNGNEVIYTYPNGTTLIYFKQEHTNTTEVVFGFKSGARFDPVGKEGLSHLLEHMLVSHGTWEKSHRELMHSLAKNNASFGACTTYDSICSMFDGISTKIDKIIETYSEMFFNPKFTEEEIKNEVETVIDEMVFSNGAEEIDGLNFFDTIAKGSPILKDPLGTIESVKNIKPEDLYEYCKKYFHSQNLVISVVSNLTFEEIKQKIDKYIMSRVDEYNENKSYQVKVENYKHKYNFNSNLASVYPSIAFDDKNLLGLCCIQLILDSKNSKEKNFKFRNIENFIFNRFEGVLYEKLRMEKRYTYYTGMMDIILPKLILKNFMVNVQRRKLDDCLRDLCQVIHNIGVNGITQKQFEEYLEWEEGEQARETKYKIVEAETLFRRYLEEEQVFIDFKKLYYQKLTLKEVNNYLKESYSNPRFYLEISGEVGANYVIPNDINKILNAKPGDLKMSKKELGQCSIDEIIEYATSDDISEKSRVVIINNFIAIIADAFQKMGLTEQSCQDDIQDEIKGEVQPANDLEIKTNNSAKVLNPVKNNVYKIISNSGNGKE